MNPFMSTLTIPPRRLRDFSIEKDQFGQVSDTLIETAS